MASASVPAVIDGKKEKLSFAKIAAAGIKPSNAQQQPSSSPNSNQKREILSSLPGGAAVASPLPPQSQPSVAPQHTKLVQLASRETKESVDTGASGPQVRVEVVESIPQQSVDSSGEGLLMPTSDDMVTQVSSSSGSIKPQSLDGKSVASGTTFALDEKDSLRPDDSASVKAVEEDDMFSPPVTGLPGSRMGSDEDVRAFRDQLREISSMEPRRHVAPPPTYGNEPKGVLYVPPHGPGIGAVPNSIRSPTSSNPNTEFPPDQKLLEALENPRDRVWVLKLEQDVIDFVKDSKESSLTLPQCHSFYRLLAHKMADYYMLGHLVEDAAAAVRLYKTPNCRIPPPLTGITAPSTAASTPPPSGRMMKILRRGVDPSGPAIANGSNIPSKSGSENGESGNEDEKRPKAPVSREEREARYEAARLRIMGSAKPAESPETPKENEDSRSSSATGRKNKKKQRIDSDDGFEARSAYSNYYTSSFGPESVPPATYSYPEYSNGLHGSNGLYPNTYNQQASMPHVSMPVPGHPNWHQQSYQQSDPTQTWAQGQTGSYDLSAEFQRLSLQNQMPAQNQNAGFNAMYGLPQYGPPQVWAQQQSQVPAPMNQPSYGCGSNFPSSSQGRLEPYAFGQLPSQAFPGRPASKSEHPLPGSYKGKNFNPQSQAFVPGQGSGSSFSPQTGSSKPNSIGPSFPGPGQLQRQASSQSQSSTFGSSHQNSPQMPPGRMPSHIPNQVMMHPLPQGPVFPRQPSPNVPLPPKPGTLPQRQADQQQTLLQNQSLPPRWGVPSSLPAKPPPTVEPFDAAKLSYAQRPPFGNQATTPRQASGFPAFGSMQPAGVNQIVNGSGGNAATKRS